MSKMAVVGKQEMEGKTIRDWGPCVLQMPKEIRGKMWGRKLLPPDFRGCRDLDQLFLDFTSHWYCPLSVSALASQVGHPTA